MQGSAESPGAQVQVGWPTLSSKTKSRNPNDAELGKLNGEEKMTRKGASLFLQLHGHVKDMGRADPEKVTQATPCEYLRSTAQDVLGIGAMVGRRGCWMPAGPVPGWYWALMLCPMSPL